MKRIISLIVACLMLITACPVLADVTTTASIVSVDNGAEFTVGSAIPLMVETNESQIERIDFYADGIKIPGTATDASKSVVWTPQVAGDYAITAVVTGQAGGTASAAAVNVRINATDEEMVKTFDTEASFSDAYYDYGNSAVTDDAINSEYTKKSNYSVKWPLGTQNTLYLKGLNANRIGYTYLNYLIYSTHPVSIWSQLVDENLGYERPEQNKITSAGWISLNAGWNAVSLELTPTAIDKYMAAESRIATINNIRFRVDYGVKIPTGLINAGENLTTQTGLSDAVVYIDSAWLSKTQASIAAPTATTVLDKKTDICNGLDKMTINFSKEMDTATLVKENVTVKGATSGPVEDFTCTASPDAMVIDFTNNLAYGDTYTVSINENVKDAYGLSVSGDKEWSFTTIQSCNNADPIVELSYPKSGASLTSNNVVVAANVTFDGNVDKVEFYKSDDTLLGTGTKGADGEYYLEVAGLTEGSYSVYAKVSFKAESTLSPKTTSAVSFTVADAVEYTLTGLKEDEEIVLNSTVKPVISRTVGINDTTGVSKVVYKVDGVEKATVASAPFTWDMPITSIDTAQSVSADVYAAGGKTSTQAVSYKAIYVSESNRGNDYGSNFDDTVQGTDFTPSTDGAAAGVFKAVYGRNGAYSYTYEDVTDIGGTGNAVKINVKKSSTSTALLYTQVAPLTDAAGANPRVLFSFDLFLPSTANYKANKDMITIKANKSGSTLMNVCDLSTLEKGKWHKFKVYFDLVSKTMTTNINENTYVETIDDAKITVYLDSTKNGAYLSFAPLQNELYIDNLYIARVLNSGYRTDYFVNGVNYTADAAGVDATVTVANRGASDVNPVVLFALYDSDMKLVKAWVENTAVMANELKHINKYVAYNQNGETGSIVKAFCWNSMNELVPVDSIR